MVKNEEYAAEISPAGIPIRHKRKEIANEIEGTNTGAMVGYVALFLSLFSIAFIQLRSAPSNFSWPISCQFRSKNTWIYSNWFW